MFSDGVEDYAKNSLKSATVEMMWNCNQNTRIH